MATAGSDASNSRRRLFVSGFSSCPMVKDRRCVIEEMIVMIIMRTFKPYETSTASAPIVNIFRFVRVRRFESVRLAQNIAAPPAARMSNTMGYTNRSHDLG
jgi:hypothetical protein